MQKYTFCRDFLLFHYTFCRDFLLFHYTFRRDFLKTLFVDTAHQTHFGIDSENLASKKRHYNDFQKLRVKSIMTVKISRRPSNMSSERIHLAAAGTAAKVPLGPVNPEPGPKLLKQVRKADIESFRLRPVAVNNTIFPIDTRINKEKKIHT